MRISVRRHLDPAQFYLAKSKMHTNPNPFGDISNVIQPNLVKGRCSNRAVLPLMLTRPPGPAELPRQERGNRTGQKRREDNKVRLDISRNTAVHAKDLFDLLSRVSRAKNLRRIVERFDRK